MKFPWNTSLQMERCGRLHHLRQVWLFSYAKEPLFYVLQVGVMNKPSAYYQLVPRMSYLPFYLQDVRDHFAPSVPQLGNDAKMWLSYRNVPVKWYAETFWHLYQRE